MTDICPHLNCLVHHGGNPCTCDMKRYCAICKKESEVPMTQPEGQPTTMTVREQIENIVRESFWGDHKNADKIAPLVDRLESLISNAKEDGDIESRLPKHEASLHITHNENTTNYESVEDYIKREEENLGIDWATPTSRERAIATNSIWELQWYPNTPIGFNVTMGATLEEILASLSSNNPKS